MLTEASTGHEDRSAIVVSGSLDADNIGANRAAWVTPDIVGYAAWTERLWHSAHEPRAVPLSVPQASALWRRVIEESPEGAELLGPAGASEWAAEAWGLLCGWNVDPARERAGGTEGDFAAFLRWCRRYRDALDANRWVDHAEIVRRLPDVEWRTPQSVCFA